MAATFRARGAYQEYGRNIRKMSRFLLILLVLVAILVGAAIFLPSLLPAESYRGRVETAASDALNRDVRLAGDISLRLFPRAEVRAADVSIANADGFGEAAFAQMGEMRVAVRLWPLINREVIIDEFVLVDPQIRLEQSGAANNWTFAEAGAPAPSGAAEGGFRRPGALPFEASIGDVRIENGLISFTNNGQTRTIEGLDMSVRMPSFDEPAALQGALRADGEAMSFAGELGSLRDFFEGRETPLTLDFGGELVTAAFDGRLLESAELEFAGDMDATIPSLRALAAFAGSPLPPGGGLERFSFDGAIAGSPGRIHIAAPDLRLDAIRGATDLTMRYDTARPRLTGRLDLTSDLDVNPYLPEQVGEAPSQTGAGVPPWPDTPIDLGMLGVADAELAITTPRLIFRDIEMSDVALNLTLNNRRLEAVLSQISLYGGSGAATVVANGRTARPSYSLRANLDALDALPFLQAAAGFDRLEGLGALDLDLTSSGASVAEIMNSLDGSGGFNFADGAIVGINVAQMIRTIQTRIQTGANPEGIGERQATDFASLGGRFTITDGLVSNQDLLMLSPLLRVEGLGQVNLGGQSLDYRLRPRAVASLQGQGGERDMRGIVVPIRLRGGFNDIAVGVDTEAVMQALLSGALTNAIGGGENGGSLEDQARGALRNAIGAGDDESDGDAAQRALRNALGVSNEGEEGDGEGEEVDPAEQLLRGLLNQRRPRTEQSGEEEEAAPADPQD